MGRAHKYVEEYVESFDPTYLSRSSARWSWHLILLVAGQVVKASLGHIPQPFLISDVCQKELLQIYKKDTVSNQLFF